MGFIKELELVWPFVRPSGPRICSMESILSSSMEPLLYAFCDTVLVLEYAESVKKKILVITNNVTNYYYFGKLSQNTFSQTVSEPWRKPRLTVTIIPECICVVYITYLMCKMNIKKEWQQIVTNYYQQPTNGVFLFLFFFVVIFVPIDLVVYLFVVWDGVLWVCNSRKDDCILNVKYGQSMWLGIWNLFCLNVTDYRYSTLALVHIGVFNYSDLIET